MINGVLKHVSHDHDIGLVKVTESFVFNDFVRPICLPTEPEFEMDRGNGIITGFGTMENGCFIFSKSFLAIKTLGLNSYDLRWANVGILSRRKCETNWSISEKFTGLFQNGALL